jgi:hypothetical protein
LCLKGVRAPAAKAPRGYRVESGALMQRGLCPRCKA